MLNPYTLLAALLFWLASLGAVGWWQHGAGKDAQKADDQQQFDAVNQALTKQKAEANAALQSVLTHNLDLLTEQNATKQKLEQAHETARRDTDSLRTELAGVRLAFQSAGGRSGGDGAPGQGSSAPGNAGAAECVVPEAIAGRLRALAYDADTLRADYELLFNWSHSLK